ncbi:type I phosphomannose isomerase catalytic subunit [Gilvibacter sediminis]|uniref:type I phosphomannose isomerase catalytic subunit n=1 Tax=Gilvibacter sediminis TaxID=379071 RepID=UPI00234FBA55|nr:type I phosphomannose isomerase catalytic subunit [Gilvibacter sediminis]MDC7998784.1 mannose-6-phosphate isomerase [Gilvibacter sediminis]
MDALPLYALKFDPILKDKVWGGTKLKTHFGKQTDLPNVGESWELSGVPGNISVVNNGPLVGRDLNSLLKEYPHEILGKRLYDMHGPVFPLLFKFIDAALDLSVQVHPADEYAQKHHDSFGKSEMWYIMQADDDADLIVDFKEEVSKENYEQAVANKELGDLLNFHKVKAGDSYFIEPGTIHAICGGVMVAEIQQTSDITYRVYDWDRPGTDGKMRELHTQEALDVLNFEAPNDQYLNYDKQANSSNSVCKSPYFDTRYLPLNEDKKHDLSDTDSFVVYMCVSGQATIELDGVCTALIKGQTAMVPAAATEIVIKTDGVELLEVRVP